MLFLLSLVIRTLTRVLTGGRSDDSSKDLEILVLRHQVRILRRKAGRPRLRPVDARQGMLWVAIGTAD